MKNVMKMLVMALLCQSCLFASTAPQVPKPVYLAVIVDASPTSQYKWDQIKLSAGRTLHSLASGDRLEIYSARKDSVVLHISSTVKQDLDNVVLRCLDDIGKIFFMDKADIAKSAELVFETFKTNSANFDCCLLIVSDGKLPNSQIKQLRRVLSAYKMRNWPVMFATFNDADKDIFRGGANNEFTVSMIKDSSLKLWLDKIRAQSLQKLIIENTTIDSGQAGKPSVPAFVPQEPVKKQPEIKTKETQVKVPVKPMVEKPARQEIKIIPKKLDTPKENKQLSTDTVTDIELKNQQTLTAKIKSSKTQLPANAALDSNTVKSVKPSAFDTSNIKLSANKPDVNNIEIHKVAKATVQSVKTSADTNQPEQKPSQLSNIKFNKKLIMLIPAILIGAFLIFYIYQKSIAGKPLLPDDKKENTNLKLMAAYNGVEYDLGDINTISTLEIGSNLGSSIPIEADGTDQRLFSIKVEKGSFIIKNLSGKILTISSVPLNPNKKCNLIMPAEIRYGDNVNIQLYQLSQEDANSSKPKLQEVIS